MGGVLQEVQNQRWSVWPQRHVCLEKFWHPKKIAPNLFFTFLINPNFELHWKFLQKWKRLESLQIWPKAKSGVISFWVGGWVVGPKKKILVQIYIKPNLVLSQFEWVGGQVGRFWVGPRKIFFSMNLHGVSTVSLESRANLSLKTMPSLFWVLSLRFQLTTKHVILCKPVIMYQ